MKFSPVTFSPHIAALSLAMTGACLAVTLPAQAASPIVLEQENPAALAQVATLQPVLLQPLDLLALRRGALPRGGVTCDPAQPQKICDVRNAAARRALEVVTEEKALQENAGDNFASPSLLIPAGLSGQLPAQVPSIIQVRAIACDPALSTEECAKLEKRIPSTPSGPLPPNASPPSSPVPPPGVTVPEPVTPPAAVEPVPVTPPSVIAPPPTGDDDLVKRPPKTGSQMPVIKPKAAPPVNPDPGK